MCAVGKYKQKNVSEASDNEPSTKVNERIYLDLCKLKAPIKMDYKINKSNWRLMMDEVTKMKFTAFFDTNTNMLEPTCTQFSKCK